MDNSQNTMIDDSTHSSQYYSSIKSVLAVLLDKSSVLHSYSDEWPQSLG